MRRAWRRGRHWPISICGPQPMLLRALPTYKQMPLPKTGVTKVTAQVDKALCIGCGRCVAVCPTHSISLGPDNNAAVHAALCRGCQACIAVCPVGAISLVSHAPVR